MATKKELLEFVEETLEKAAEILGVDLDDEDDESADDESEDDADGDD